MDIESEFNKLDDDQKMAICAVLELLSATGTSQENLDSVLYLFGSFVEAFRKQELIATNGKIEIRIRQR